MRNETTNDLNLSFSEKSVTRPKSSETQSNLNEHSTSVSYSLRPTPNAKTGGNNTDQNISHYN